MLQITYYKNTLADIGSNKTVLKRHRLRSCVKVRKKGVMGRAAGKKKRVRKINLLRSRRNERVSESQKHAGEVEGERSESRE